MGYVIVLVVIAVAVGLTIWSSRRARRRVLATTSEGARRPLPGADPQQAANITRASMDATNSGGWL